MKLSIIDDQKYVNSDELLEIINSKNLLNNVDTIIYDGESLNVLQLSGQKNIQLKNVTASLEIYGPKAKDLVTQTNLVKEANIVIIFSENKDDKFNDIIKKSKKLKKICYWYSTNNKELIRQNFF